MAVPWGWLRIASRPRPGAGVRMVPGVVAVESATIAILLEPKLATKRRPAPSDARVWGVLRRESETVPADAPKP